MKKEIKNMLNQNNSQNSSNMDEIIRMAIKKAPKLDLKREDMQRGRIYYMTGGDPDTRNQI